MCVLNYFFNDIYKAYFYHMKNSIFENKISALKYLPNKEIVGKWIAELFEWIFCINSKYSDYNVFLEKEVELKNIFFEIIEREYKDKKAANEIIDSFFNSLPFIHNLLKDDLETVLKFDPAARSHDEVLLSYPGFYSIAIHRLVHSLWKLNVPIIPRLIAELSHSKTGIDIHPAAIIGERFFIDHGTGVVIGETTEIGNDVKIYQGVTLGALSVSKDKVETKRHPTIGNRVIIYANATILGGKTYIGDDSQIGGNVWITNSIPPNSLVYHKSEIIIKSNSSFPEPLDYVI